MKKSIRKASLFVVALGLTNLPIQRSVAEELFLIQEVPDPAVLANMMFPASSEETNQKQYKLRGIHFKEPDTATDVPAKTEQTPQNTDGMSIGFNIQFAYNSPELLPETLPYLDAVGEMMNLERTRETKLLISGHADSSGETQYNLALSEARALAVSNYLEQKYEVDNTRIRTIGYGESKPLQNTDPFDPSNRRVEFHPEP